MGGTIAVRVAAKRALPTLEGLVVIDVVEVRAYTFFFTSLPDVSGHQGIIYGG